MNNMLDTLQKLFGKIYQNVGNSHHTFGKLNRAIYESAKRNKINTMKPQLFIYDSAYVLVYESAKFFDGNANAVKS